MSRASAEKKFAEIGMERGPKVDLSFSRYDFSGIGGKVNQDEILELRDSLTQIAAKYGFKTRHGYQQETFPTKSEAVSLDREFAGVFRSLTPMRWSEAGSREVWSWFALGLLPDITHWRWRPAVAAKKGDRKGEWYKARWIGFDLTRHTWARYWWRSVQLESDPALIEQLHEHDLNHLQERADTLGANPVLMANFARQVIGLAENIPGESSASRRDVIEDSAKRMLRRLHYVDDSVLTEDETVQLVAGFVEDTRTRLL